MSAVNVLDRYYLGITLLVTTGYQLLGFFIAWTYQFDKITDFTGGSNFFLLAILTLCIGNEYHPRQVIASVFVMVWALRIAGFLLYRVLKTGSDTRFDDIRSHFFKFLGFWVGQILWVWVVSFPVIVVNSPPAPNPSFGTGRDIAGIVIWAVGWVIETISDAQKFRHKQSENGHKPMTKGLWAWSRHPPYFGEMLCWWGIWTLCLSGSPLKGASIISPLFTVILLMFGSGVPTAEKPQAKKYYLKSKSGNTKDDVSWKMYKRYLERTSILIPLPPALYSHLPKFVKRTILLDFSFYQLDETNDVKD